MRDLFDLPDLAAMDDGIANGTHEPRPGEPAAAGAVHRAARGLFAAPPAPLHRHRAGALPELRAVHQLPVLHRRVRALGHAVMAKTSGASEYVAFVEPGNVVTRRVGMPAQPGDELGAAPAALPQMPAYHLVRPTAPASPWSTSASARPTPRPSPTTSPCCARMPGSCSATAPACATRSSWATTCWPTATCARTMCSTRNCRCGCRSRRWPRCRWRWSRRWPTSRSSRATS
jgi:hypothetical protein